MARTTDIAHEDARRLIERAIDKAEQIKMRGAIVVIGGTGALVSASRMDNGGAGAVNRAKSKAWIAATQQIPSAEHLGRLQMIPPPMVAGFPVISPEACFPGAGGMPIREGGRPDAPVIAGVAASGAGIGPFVGYPGVEPEDLIAAGRPSNGEDLLVHYALGIPYAGQHGDDMERWVRVYGSFPDNPGEGRGMAAAPPAQHQAEHLWALGLADQAMELARQRGVRISVAIVDAYGDPIQIDRMDGGVASSPAVSTAVAGTAATFGLASEDVASAYPGDALNRLADALPFPVLPAIGGVPLTLDGTVIAGIGVAGPQPQICREIAREVAERA